ncbi:hypothetical protein [Xenorhabdus innexi]|uniref:Rhs family protein n=1 Tax=Xenorhabdus innexi TaxID=290109 RepID=A0A1N6MWY7_9GAMM|nr:hypothetical protein [Xenorhabdus innexi]PHM23567.1 Rhs family protein [Xenorhabdus innexi]SIP73393.1 hypothetical protein XIS1_1950001 [Xenorhabdus innexi]
MTLDGTIIATGKATKTATQLVTTTLLAPYMKYNDIYTGENVVETGGTYSIILSAGEIGRDTFTHYQNAAIKAQNAGNNNTSEAVLGAGLAAVGYAYISQSTDSNILTANLGDFNTNRHFSVGIAGYNGSTYVDFPLQIHLSSAKHSLLLIILQALRSAVPFVKVL